MSSNSREDMQRIISANDYLKRIVIEMILNVSDVGDKGN